MIETRDLTHYYGTTVGVDGLDLRVEAGEVFGFLGPNGAGKTTTIRLLLDLIRPTRGEATLFGRPVGEADVRGRIGYLPGELALDGRLTGRETLDFLARLGGGPPARRADLCQRLALSDADLARRVREYSRGMKQKLGLVAAFQHDPELLVLDEPTTGLDPLMRESVFELLAEARRSGRTVFHSSHVLSEVDRTCDRVAMLRDGRLVDVLRVDDIRRASGRSMVIEFRDAAPLAALEEVARVRSVDGARVTIEVDAVQPVIQVLAAHEVRFLAFPEPGLEELFDTLYRATS
ncbi:MAG: ABC transporter ATP-binding protein [Longimicrobiales bacterium]|nr:ABC transporter ATP-binding protein [Longimicrobiales bacterium]